MLAIGAVNYNKDDAQHTRLVTAASVTVKAAEGTVHRLLVGGSLGATTGGTVTLYNGAATIVWKLAAGSPTNSYAIGARFTDSIIVMNSVAGDDVTVVWT